MLNTKVSTAVERLMKDKIIIVALLVSVGVTSNQVNNA
jgi:hypothetical protein